MQGNTPWATMHKEVMSCPIPDDPDSKQALLTEIKSRGNAAFKAKDYTRAVNHYSAALNLCVQAFSSSVSVTGQAALRAARRPDADVEAACLPRTNETE